MPPQLAAGTMPFSTEGHKQITHQQSALEDLQGLWLLWAFQFFPEETSRIWPQSNFPKATGT